MPEGISETAEAMNAFVRIAAEQKKLDRMVAPLKKRLDELEARIAAIEKPTKAPKGKES